MGAETFRSLPSIDQMRQPQALVGSNLLYFGLLSHLHVLCFISLFLICPEQNHKKQKSWRRKAVEQLPSPQSSEVIDFEPKPKTWHTACELILNLLQHFEPPIRSSSHAVSICPFLSEIWHLNTSSSCNLMVWKRGSRTYGIHKKHIEY